MSDLNKKDIEALLGGRAPDGLEQMAALLARVRQEASASVDPAVASRHIAAAANAVRETPVPSPVPVSTTRRTWRRRTVFAGLLSTIFGKVFMGAVALAAVTAGAGAAGVLPDPVQGFVDGNEEIHRIANEIREQAVLHEQEPAGDQVHLRDQDQLQVNQPEQPAESGQISEPNQFQNQFQNQPVEPSGEPNQFQHEFQHHLGTMGEDTSGFLLQYQNWFQWQWMYQGGDETTDTTVPQMHQQEHQQGIDQGANTTVPQNQQQAQQQGLSEDPEDPIDQQQQQQQQQSTGPSTTTTTEAGTDSSQDVPGGFGQP